MSEHLSPTRDDCDGRGSDENRVSKRPRISFQEGVIKLLEEKVIVVKQERDRYFEYGSYLQGERYLKEMEDRELREREQLRRREEKKNRKEEEAQKKERESLKKKIRKLEKENGDLRNENIDLVEKNDNLITENIEIRNENTDLVEKNDNLITENAEIRNELERRTKQNELAEVKLNKAKSLLQKVVENTGLSEILVNSVDHEKGIQSATQEEITSAELKKEVEEQKLKIEKQSVTIMNRGILLKQSQDELRKMKRRLESIEQMVRMSNNPVMQRTLKENSNQRISPQPALVKKAEQHIVTLWPELFLKQAKKAEQPMVSRDLKPVGTGEDLVEQSLRSDKTLRSKLFLKKVNPKAESDKNH